MNIIFCYTIYRVIQGVGFYTFMTLNLVKVPIDSATKVKDEFFSNHAVIPHAFLHMVHMLIIIFFANININSRVAHTIPFYFWGSAAIIVE